MNFLNALDKLPNLIEKYEVENNILAKDLPIFKEIMDTTFKKESELKDLKSQLDSLSRQINLSLVSKDGQNKDNSDQVDVLPKIIPLQSQDFIQQPSRGPRM